MGTTRCIKVTRRQWLTLGCTGLLVAGAIACANHVAQAGADETELPNDGSPIVVEHTEYVPTWDELHPVIEILSDGTAIQRTPTEDITPTDNGTAYYHHPEENVPANTYFMRADAKGCGACHEDLAETLKNCPYGHLDLSNSLGLEQSLDTCLGCHTTTGGASSQTVKGEFGTMIHGLHSNGEADCWNCHDASDNNGGEMKLWDLVKHEKLHGITDIADESLDGNFGYRTDETLGADQLYNVMWGASDMDHERERHILNGDPETDEIFNEWTITVSGEVGQQKTWTLEELIAEAPSETVDLKFVCGVSPVNGPYVGQYAYTGIPIQWILEQAGVNEGANKITLLAPDGSRSPDSIDNLMNGSTGLLVYEIGGERLTWAGGFPCIYAAGGGVRAYYMHKQVSDIVVSTEPDFVSDADNPNLGLASSVPLVGIFNLREGQIIKTGEPFEFHGYTDAYSRRVAALEISMDRGKTWKRFEMPDTNVDNWTTWTYEFTPEVEGAYCFAVRGVTEDGTVTEQYVEKMVVAKDEIPEL